MKNLALGGLIAILFVLFGVLIFFVIQMDSNHSDLKIRYTEVQDSIMIRKKTVGIGIT